MKKQDFYLSKEELKEKSQDYMSGSWGKHAKTMAIVYVIMAILVIGCVLAFKFLPWYVGAILTFVSSIMFILLFYGHNVYCLENARLTQKGIKLIFSGFGKNIFKIIFVKLVASIIQVVGFALLIIPGIYWSYGLSMVDFVLRDNPKLSAFGVIKRSFKLMKSNKMRLFKVDLSFIGWFILVEISGGIAGLWIAPYYNTTKALFYEDLKTDF